MAYDLQGALAEGYTPTEIAEHLAKQRKYDIAGARKEGYTDDEIAQHLAGRMPKRNKSVMGDLGTDIKRGIEELPGMVAGVADIPFALAGHPVAQKLATKAGELTGFQPGKWAEEAKYEYSPQRQQSEQEIQKVWDDKNTSAMDVAKAYLTHPGVVAGKVAEALPGTLAGGFAGRAAAVGSKLITPAIGAGIGEGAITSGSLMNQATQGGENEQDVQRKALAALGAGVITGGIGGASAGLSRRLGIVDPESIFNKPAVQALTETEVNSFLTAANRGIGSRIGVGAVKEGLIEELPQSAQEQMWQNYAENKPIMQGVSRAAVEGALAGSLMGAGFNTIFKGMSADEVKAEVDRRTQAKADEIKSLQERMATEAMGGTRESRPVEAALAAQSQEDKMGRENVRTELARPIYQTKEEVTAVLEKLREVYPELDQTQLNKTRQELQQIRETLPSQAEAAKQLVQTKPDVAPVVEPTATPEITSFMIDDDMLNRWGIKGKDARAALKEYGDLTSPENQQQVRDILTGYPKSDKQKAAAREALRQLDEIIKLQTQGAPNVELQNPAVSGVQNGGENTAPVGQGAEPSVGMPVPGEQGAPTEVAEPVGGGVGVPGGLPGGYDGSTGESGSTEPSPLVEPEAPQSTEVIKPVEEPVITEPTPPEVTSVEDEPIPEKINYIKEIKKYQEAVAKLDPEIAKEADDLIKEYNEARKVGKKGSMHVSAAEKGIQSWMDWAKRTYPNLEISEARRKKYIDNPTTAERLRQAFNKLYTPNLLRVKPPQIFGTYDDIPDADLREAVRGRATAFVMPSTQQEHYIAEVIKKGDEIGRIMHEKGTHLGMPKLVGRDRVNALANRVESWSKEKGDKVEHKIAREAMRRANQSKEEKGSDRWREEIVAYFADIGVNKYKIDPLKNQPKEFAKVAGWLRELWNGVLSTLRKLQYNPDALTAQDIVSMIYGASRIEMHEDYEGRPNKPAEEGEPAPKETAEEPTEEPISEALIPGMGKKKKVKKATSQEEATAKAAGRQFYQDQPEPTFKDRVKATVGSDWAGWLVTKLVGGGEALALKGNKMFGPEARLNPATGKELGYLNYHRALHDNDLATGAAQFGYLEMDKEGVIHVRDSDDNVVALNDLANKAKAAMMKDGMSEAAADDAFAHMVLAGRFKELQKMGVLTEDEFNKADHAYGQEMKQKYAAEYQEWQDMYQRIRARTMDIMVKSGTFSKAKAKEFLDRLEYIPFNREQDLGTSDAVFLRSLLSAKGEHHIKGSNRSVKNVMDNIVDNQVWLMKRAVRNNASNLIADTMEYMNKQNPLLGGYETVQGDKSPNVISYLKDGELRYFKVLDANDAVIFAAAPAIGNTAIRLMRMFTGMLRRGVTLMPSFHYGQIIQDAMRAPAVAGTKAGMLGLMKTSVPQFVGNIKGETELAKSLRRAGIVGQIDYQDTYDNWRKEVLGAKRKGFGSILEGAERIAQSNDLATRAAVYDNVLKETGDENAASLRALMMINFQNRGHSQAINTLMAMVPFVNSRIQGEYRLLMALTGRIPGVSKQQAKQLIMWRMAKMAAFTAIYAMVSGGDDEYERASEEIKNHNFLFPVGDVGVKVPVAPEFLPLKVAIEKAYRLGTDQEFESGAKAARAELSAVAGLFLGAGDFTPTMIKPLVENMTNYSFFTGHNLVGYNQMSKDVNLRFNEGTSDFSKGISNMLQDIGGNTVNISPIKLDNLIRGWFGSMGKDLLYTTDMISGDKAAPKFNQLPLAGAMFYDMEGGALKSDFYDLKDAADRAHNTLNDYKDEPEKAMAYYEENKPLLAVYSRLDKMSEFLNHARKEKEYYTKTDPDTARAKISEVDTRVHEMLKQNLPLIQKFLSESDGM